MIRSSSDKGNIIIIEMDGATWDIIDPLIEQGELPNFKTLKKGGVYGEVDTTYTGSPVIWTAIFTGKSKEHFGSAFFGVDRARLRAKRVWEIAAERGFRVGVLHSLLSWPPMQVDGFIIPDVFAVGPETFPQRYQYFQKLYLSRHGRSILRQGYYLIRSLMDFGGFDVLTALARFCRSAALRQEFLDVFRHRLMVVTRLDHHLFMKLYGTYRPRLYTYHLHALDTVSHKYWLYKDRPGRYGQVIADFYREADAFLGRVMAMLGERDTLLVMADHGFTEFSDGRGKFELNLQAFRRLFALHTAARLVRMGDSFVLNLGDSAQQAGMLQLIEELSTARLQDGAPLFINVQQFEESIHFQLPKNLLETRSLMEETVTFPRKGQVPFRLLFRAKEFMDTGIHAAGRGLFAVSGGRILKDQAIGKVGVFDIAPTLLALLGLPVARDMDGEFDPRWFTSEALEEMTVEYIDSYESNQSEGEHKPAEVYSEEEVQDLEERLKILGYM